MTDKQMRFSSTSRTIHFTAAFVLLAASSVATSAAHAQRFPAPGSSFPTAPQQQFRLPPLPTPTAITPNGTVVEDVIARINDQIITRSEYERALQGLQGEAKQTNMSPADFEDRRANMLRDMIDQQILLSKGKELGITGDAETMRQLDELRKQNHLDSMEQLQKAAESQGISYEDFKRSIRDRVITQSVVRQEVGRRINMTQAQEQVYYDAHKNEFQTPEQIHLSEILVATPDGATDAQVADAQAKADAAAAKLAAGTPFAELAKTASSGPTASAGGDLGDFKRGTLGQVLEDATFSLPAGGVTKPIRTRQGFVILRVDSHQNAGVPPLSAVEGQVQEALYMDALQPALRAYLTKQRDEAYIDIKPGFVDNGSNRKESKPTFTSYAPPAPKKKTVAKQRMEQARAAKAAAELAAARQKAADKAAAKQAGKGGTVAVSAKGKVKKPAREKIRFGQSPRNALPTAVATQEAENNAPLQGVAPGVAMAPTTSVTTITTGVGVENEDPLGPKQESDHKTRFSSREKVAEDQRLQSKVVKTNTKASNHSVAATSTEKADEKQQAAPLGLNGDTTKKKKKRQKGDPKERLQEKPKETEPAAAPVAPTVNPALGSSPMSTTTTTADTPKPAKTVGPNTIPPAYSPAPGASPAGQPIPATTSADPTAPTTTPAPH